MVIAYLLLAHSNELHLAKLISRLRSDSAIFFVHIDKKTGIDKFLHLQSADVRFVDQRAAVYWGDFSQVEAILLLMNAALAAIEKVDRCVLLSGVDYPLRSTEFIQAFFDRNRAKEYINLVAVPSIEAGKPLARFTTYRLRADANLVERTLFRILCKLRLRSRHRDVSKYLGNLELYAGSTWWALSRNACEYVVKFTMDNRNIVDFFKNVEYSDESFFQTILANSSYKNRMARNLTYTDWSAGGASPAAISTKHLPLFEAQSDFGPDNAYGDGPMLFARKFSDLDSDLLVQLDLQIAKGEAPR